MLKVEHSSDYLKDEGRDSQAVELLKKKQQSKRSLQPKSRLRRQYNPDDINIAKLFLAIREHKTGNPQLDKINEIKVLLIQIRNINDIDFNDNGNTPLHVAVSKEHEDIVKLLLKKGAKVDIKNNIGSSPLDIAVRLDNQIIIGELQKYSELGSSNQQVSSVQQQPKNDDTLKELQTREPISIFQKITKEKDQSKKQNLEGLLNKLRSSYPDDLKIGVALKTGDCFFDSVAQGLNELKDKGLVENSERFNVKSLRKDCADYARENNNKDSWTYEAVIKDAAIGGYFAALKGPYGPIQDPKTKINVIDKGETFRKYLKDIKNMATGTDYPAIWGRPEIEGQMISNKYGVVLCFYSTNEENGQKITVTKITPDNNDPEVFIEGVNFDQLHKDSNEKVLRIVNYKEHFVPLLGGLTADITENVKVPREEVYGVENKKSFDLEEDSDLHNNQAQPFVDTFTTEGFGNCFFHAVFGDNSSGTYKAERAQDMRMEWHKFLSQFTSLSDPKMPNPLRDQLEKVFDGFLNTPGDLTVKSEEIKGLAEQTNKKIEEADSKIKELQEEIIKKFRDDGDFRKVIYPVIEKAITQRNERNVDSPRDQKTLLSIEDLLKEENKERLYNDIIEDLESCALILNSSLSKKEYGNTYNPKIIKDSFLNDEVLYETYLEAISDNAYYVFFEEVPILASLANIKITAYYDNGNRLQVFEPNKELLGSYQSDENLWGEKEEAVIFHKGLHFSHATISHSLHSDPKQRKSSEHGQPLSGSHQLSSSRQQESEISSQINDRGKQTPSGKSRPDHQSFSSEIKEPGKRSKTPIPVSQSSGLANQNAASQVDRKKSSNVLGEADMRSSRIPHLKSQAGSSQQSSNNRQSVRGTIDSAQHQQINPNSPNFIDSDDEREKNTELFSAIKNSNLQKVQELLKAGVKVNIIDKNNKDNTPLHYAIEREKKEIAKKLLQKWKADINAKNNKGDTPLHVAVSKGHQDIVELLLKEGAKIDIENNAGKSPLILANELDNSNPNKQGIIQILETLLSSKTQIQPRQRTNIDAQGKQENRDDQRPGPSRQVNNPTQLHKQSSVKQHPEQSPSDNSNFYQKRSGTSGISGQLYETKLLMLILFRALNDEKINEFYLGTNVDGVGALDDIIFRYNLSGQEKPRVIFIQAKHKDNSDNKKVTVGEVQKKGGDFSLHSYLDSYLRIKYKFNPESDDVIFKGEFQNIDCDFVIYTPAKENFSEKKSIEQPNTGDVLIYTSEEEGKRFQFEYKDENIGLLVKIVSESHTKILAENFAKFILSSTDNMMSDGLIKSYHVVLAQKVIRKVSDGKWKFRDEFFESKEDLLRILKKVLCEKIVYDKKSTTKPEEIRVLVEAMLENTSPDTISKLIGSVVTFDSEESRLKFVEKGIPQEVIDLKNKLEEKEVTQKIVNDAIWIAGKKKLQSLSLKLPSTFGNLDLALRKEKRLEHLTLKFIDLLKDGKVTNNYVVTIDDNMVGNQKRLNKGDIAINGGIGGLVGNLLIFDEETSMLKFNNNEESLPKNAKQLFQKLKDKIEKENGLTNKKLDSYRFEINVKNFPRLSLIDEKHDKSLVREFLDKIKFFTNQAKEDGVEEILKQEISEYYLQNRESLFDIKTDAIFLDVHDKVQKWWKLPKEAPYLTKSCSYFNEVKDRIINNPILNILRIIYFHKIKGSDIEFSSDSIKELKLEDFVSDPNKQILNIIAKEKLLSAVKLVQNFVTADFIDLDYLYSLGGDNDYLEKAITELKQKGGENNILVIHCNDIEVERVDELYKRVDELYNRLSSIIQSNSNKKVILITQEQDPLAAKFKEDSSTKYTEKKDERNILTDLTTESQEKLLEREKVIFQGKEVSLGTLVDDGSKHLLDGEVLSKLINKEKVKIGKALIDSKYEDIKDYYISRTFNRQVKIKKEILKEKDSKFLVTYSSQVNRQNLKEDQDIVLISDTGEDFKHLCDNHKKHNIYWLKKEGDDLIWQKSYGTLSKLRKSVDTNAQAIQEYKPEKITDITDKVVIISAEPGMGKSTVLTPLALKTKESLWIVRINLLDYSTELKIETEKKTKLNEAEAIKFLYRIVGFQLFQGEKEETTEKKGKREQTVENVLHAITVKDSKISLDRKSTQDLDLLEIELFNNFYNQGRIVLLFDGFDEISPDYTEKVIELLQVLKNSKVEKLWITTRPYNFIQEELEDQLSVFSYSLKPLLLEEQKGFLRKFWKEKLKLNELDEQRSGVFIDELLGKLPKSIGDKDFMSIPLHASMVAEVFTDAFKSFYDSNKQELSDEHKRKIEEQDLVTLYERFIDIKFYKIRFGEKKPGMNIDDPDMKGMVEEGREKLIEDHMKLALYAIFNEDEVKKLLTGEEMDKVRGLIDDIKEGKESTGIIEQVIDNKPRFIHRTFAEYFAASYFWERFKSVKSDKFEDFVENIITKNLIEDDRIQISKFLQLKAKKDFESNIDFPDKQNKLRTLLTKLLDQTTRYDYNGNGKQSTKLLFGIVEFSLSTKEKSNVDVIENNDQLKLLCVSAEMGYIKLVEALETKLNKEFLQKYLKRDKWFYSPLWLAAQNAHLDVLEVLVKKFSYDPNWKDKDSETLVQRIFQKIEFDVLRSCLKLDIVDGKPYEDLNHRQELPILEAFQYVAPSDVIELLIEKTDSNLVNGFKYPEISSQISPAQLIAVQSLKYGKEITELAIKKGIDFSDVINVLLFEYCYESLNSPINKLNYASNSQPSFHSDKEFLNLFERIELLLKAGVGYNHKDIKYSKTTLQYAKQIHYIHELLDGVHKLHNQKINKSSNPLGTILKLIIDNVGSSPDFEGYEFVESHQQGISLSLNYKDESSKYNKRIPLLPDNIPKLLFKFYEDSNTNLVENALGKFRDYITNAKEEIGAFKQYPDSKVYNEILTGYREMLKFNDYQHLYHQFYSLDERKEKENRYQSLDDYEQDLLERVLNLYIRQDYEINDALKEVEEEVLRLKEIINKLKENSGHKKYETGEILDILAIKSMDTNEELQDLISKIYECGGIQFLSETWLHLNLIGQQKIMGTLELMFKFADQSSKILELLKKLDDSYKTLTEAIKNKDYQMINNILQDQDIEPDFIKAIINGQDDKYGSPLHYAAFKGDVQVTKILLESGANPNLKMQGSGILLSTADETQKDEDLEYKYQGCTPLHVAALNKQLEVAKILVNDWDADVNAMSTGWQVTPLHMAAESGNLDMVKFLVKEGKADVNAMSTGWQVTPLHMAAESGNLDMVKFLVEEGKADVNAKNKDERTPLYLSARKVKLDVIDFLVEKGGDLNVKDKYGKTPLQSIDYENYSFDDFVFTVPGALNNNDEDKRNVLILQWAAYFGNLDVVKSLVEKGADVNAKDELSRSLIYYAAYSGNLNVIEFLVEEGADVNAKEEGGRAPLHTAVQLGYLKIVKLLLEKGAHYDVQNAQGKTPLDLAKSGSVKNLLSDIDKLFQDVQDGKEDKVNSLLKGKDDDTLKAVLHARNRNQKTLLKFAIANKQQDIANLLIEKLRLIQSSDQQQEAVKQGGEVSAKECLPSTSSGRSKREAIGEKCLFTWEDVDEFNEEKDEKRDLSKIKIDSERFVSYIKDLPKEKQSQLIQLASEVKIGDSSQGLVSKLIGNQKVMNHLGRVAGMTMHGMMAKNVLADFLNSNYQGVAINVGFIAGGQGFAKVAEAASLKGLKLAEEGKLLVGQSLKAASPFLARGTSAFVVYDLVNQIKAFKNGTEEALVGVVGDSIYLGVDAAEIGVEVAEAFGVLEGVSSVTGPIGATIGAVVFVGTDIYMAVKRVDKIDQIIHLTGDEKFVEGLRAFIGMKPEQYIEELMEKKQLYNQLVKQGLGYLKQHSDIQSYVFPTTDKLDSKVLLDRKRTGIRWSRARPDDLNEGRVFCLPQGNDEPAPDYGSYLCENAIGIFANKTGDHTLINLGEGKDYAKGFLNSPNIFVVNNGSKEYYGGNKDDIFVLQAEYIKGHLSGEGGINTLDTTLFALQEEQLNIQLEIGEIADYFRDNWLKICEINKVIGRANKAETITVSCDGCNSNVRLIDGQSGNEEIKDRINIIDDSCDYQMQIVVRPNTAVYNRALKGSFDYLVPLNSSGSAEVSFIYGPERFNVNNTFWFAYQAVDIKSIDVKYINVFNRTEHEVKFNFVESNKEFNVTISYSENPAYRLGKSGEIRIGNKGNLYMLESSDKSSEEVIRDYLPVANRVSKMSFFIQSVLSNETVVIGSGNHEVIHSNPAYRSHLVGNGGENVYVIDSETTEVIIHDVDEENSIDTIDLRNVVRQVRGELSNQDNFQLKVLKSANDLLLEATVVEVKPTEDSSVSKMRKHEYCTVRLKDGVNWYNKTHVIVDNAPMKINLDNNEWSLKPQPLMFERDKEIIVVTNQDIEQGSEIITPRKGGNYKFVRSNDNDLMITNAFDLTITKNDLCTITLSKFYETPRMKTLFIKFADKEIILKEHQEEISTARDVNVVKKEHKDQVYNDVFNPEVMMLSDQPVTHRHRHSRHREQARHRRSTTSSSTRPTGWINDLFGWVKSSVSGLLSSKPESTKSPISQVDAKMDVNGTIILLDMLIRKVTGQKYVSTADQSISPLEAQGYALNITKGFEKVVEQAGLKSGVSMHRLNIDYMGMQKEITRKVMSGKFNEISGILSSYVEKACPDGEAGYPGKLSPKKFDKFMIEFNKGLDVTLNQSIEHNGDGRLEVDVVKEQKTNSGPQSYLSNASVQGHLTQNKVKLIS